MQLSSDRLILSFEVLLWFWHIGHTENICLDWQLEAKFYMLGVISREMSLHGLSEKTGNVRRRVSTL